MNELVVSKTPNGHAVLWQDGSLMNSYHKYVMTLNGRASGGYYSVALHLAGRDGIVCLYTTSSSEAKRRAEQLYDMVMDHVQEILTVAHTGFMLRQEDKDES